MKDNKGENTCLSPAKVVHVKRMADVLNRSYLMQVARSFWRIDRVEEERGVEDASFYYAQQVETQLKGNWTPDQSTRVPNTSSKAGRDTTEPRGRPEPKGELFTINYNEHNLNTPKVDRAKARQTTPRRR
jgi:hypothetical protein